MLSTHRRSAAAQACAGRAPVVRMLSLQDCINMALTNSSAVLKGNNDVALAGTQVLAAYGQYLPNAQAAGGVNYDLGNNFYASTGPYLSYQARSAYNYQLTSSLNIITGYYNYSNLKAAKLNQAGSRADAGQGQAGDRTGYYAILSASHSGPEDRRSGQQ